MYKEELQEQVTRCKDMQSKCRIDDIDTFIRLSNRIEELTGKIDKTEKQLVVPVQNDENKNIKKFFRHFVSIYYYK